MLLIRNDWVRCGCVGGSEERITLDIMIVYVVGEVEGFIDGRSFFISVVSQMVLAFVYGILATFQSISCHIPRWC